MKEQSSQRKVFMDGSADVNHSSDDTPNTNGKVNISDHATDTFTLQNEICCHFIKVF